MSQNTHGYESVNGTKFASQLGLISLNTFVFSVCDECPAKWRGWAAIHHPLEGLELMVVYAYRDNSWQAVY